jgi:HEAT repeat protein
MADQSPFKGLLVIIGLLCLVLAYFLVSGVSRLWEHSRLAKAVHDPDPVIRMDAVRKAGKTGHEDLLIEALHDDDPDIRYVAVWGLGGDGSEKKVRALLELFKDDHSYVWEQALETLRYLPGKARQIIYKGTEDEDARVRAGAAYALAYFPGKEIGMGYKLSPPPRPAKDREVVVSLMTRLLKDDNLEVRKAASFCLFSYHLETEEALRVLSTLEEIPEEKDQDARDLTARLKREAEWRSR